MRGTQLIFYARSTLETAPAVLTIRRRDVTNFNFKGKTGHIYKAARVSYQSPATKQLISATVTDDQVGKFNNSTTTGDTYEVVERAENATDAQAKAAAALHAQNMHQTMMHLTLPGSTKLVAGVNVAIRGFGGNDGTYLLTKARHRLERSSGYTIEVEGRAV